MIFTSTLDLTSWRRISSALAYPEISSGSLCISAMRSLSGTESDIYEGHRTRHDPWFDDFKESLKTMTFEPEPSSSAPCLMAKGAKVTKRSSYESSDDESDDDFVPSYSKLATIASKQQRSLEKVQNLLDKSDDLLGEEMDQSQTLTDNLQRLQTKFDNLQSRHNTLLSDHEKLSYEFLQRKQDLEQLRLSYEDL